MRARSSRIAKDNFNKLDFIKGLADGRKLFLCKYRDSQIVQCPGKGYLNPNGQFFMAKDHNHPLDNDFEVSDSDTSRTEDKDSSFTKEEVPEEEEVKAQPISKKSPSPRPKVEEPEEPNQNAKTTKRKHKFTVSDEVYQRAMMSKPEKFRVMRNGRWHADQFYRFGGFEGASNSSDFTSVLDQTKERGEIVIEEEESAVSPHASSSISEASTTDMPGRTIKYERRLKSLEDDVNLAEKNKNISDNQMDDDSSAFTEQCNRQVEQLDPAAQTRLFLRLQNVTMAQNELLKDKEEELHIKKAHIENLNSIMNATNPKE